MQNGGCLLPRPLLPHHRALLHCTLSQKFKNIQNPPYNITCIFGFLHRNRNLDRQLGPKLPKELEKNS